MRLAFFFVLLVLHTAHADLFEYIAKPEPQAAWVLQEKSELGGCDIYRIKLTSQVWHGIPWEHDLVLFRPKDADVQDKMYLLNMGGSIKPQGLPYGVMLAGMMKAPVAILLGIPNQPLFDGKREDDLIAETFVRYLETKDDSWPLLFPMVKSLVKAMDAVQEFSAKQWPKRIESFVVGGASKRGWTTWLTAAADKRVMAITPMVIDVLNMRDQLKRQVECFGAPSEQIRPYTARGLIPIPDTEIAGRLWKSVDPYSYRDKFTLPKLVLLGNNDRYWAPDALNLYWEGLPGPKWISYSPNAGHDLKGMREDGKPGDGMRAVQAAAAFARHEFTGKPMPEITWKHDDASGQMRLTIQAHPAPKEIRVWHCVAPSKDTRNAHWESRVLPVNGESTEVLEPRPVSGVVSFYAECAYEIDGLPYCLCTQLRMGEAGK